MKIAQEKSKQHHDKKAKMPDFKVGDWVLLKSMKVPKGHSPKLYRKHEGPFYITELGPNFTYKLTSCADHTEVKCLINASRLKQYVKPNLVRNENQHQARVPPLEPENMVRQIPVQLEMSASQKGNKQPPNPVQLELSGSQKRKEQPSSPNTASKQNDTNIKRVPVRILRHKTVNKEKQYCVRWKDSWELGENLSKLREIFPHRVLKRKRTNNIQYCLVRWRDSWEPAKKCSDEDIQKYNIARANERRKKKPQPQPRH